MNLDKHFPAVSSVTRLDVTKKQSHRRTFRVLGKLCRNGKSDCERNTWLFLVPSLLCVDMVFEANHISYDRLYFGCGLFLYYDKFCKKYFE